MTQSKVEPLQFAVNNNGDSHDRLLSNYRAVLDAAQELAVTMGNACPHGRNYQTVTDGNAKLSEDIAHWNELRTQVQNIADIAMQSALKAMKD